MHTFQTAAAPRFTINHNGDFSGDVIINYFVRGVSSKDKDVEEMTVPFELLRQLVAEYVRSERIRALEHASAENILGVSK